MLKYFLMIVFVWFKFSYGSKVCGKTYEPLYIQFEDTKEDTLLCPAENVEAKDKLEKLSEHHYEMKYCLWNKYFRPNREIFCESEVTPVFRMLENVDKEPISCSADKNHFLHYFGYYYCGDKIKLEKLLTTDIPEDKNYIIEILGSKIIISYIVCFDISKHKTVWTKHSIETPELFQTPSYVEYYCKKDIRTDSFYMNKSFFTDLKKIYNLAEKKGTLSDIAVFPQPLVPADHFALRQGKKTTYHYINRAPLWDKLVPLMTAIDQGIKKAAIKASSKVRNGPYENILIFTKTKTAHTMMTRLKKWFKIEPFEPNIWQKFIYDPVHNKGVMIYIHNTPGIPVVKKCHIEMECNFKEWTEDPQIRSQISEKELQYAYCCPINTSEAANEFSSNDFYIQEYFDINFMALH